MAKTEQKFSWAWDDILWVSICLALGMAAGFALIGYMFLLSWMGITPIKLFEDLELSVIVVGASAGGLSGSLSGSMLAQLIRDGSPPDEHGLMAISGCLIYGIFLGFPIDADWVALYPTLGFWLMCLLLGIIWNVGFGNRS